MNARDVFSAYVFSAYGSSAYGDVADPGDLRAAHVTLKERA